QRARRRSAGPRRAAGARAPPRHGGRMAAARRRARGGTPTRPGRAPVPRRGPTRASYRRVLALSRRRELALQAGDPDEPRRRLVRERLARPVRGELLLVEGVLGAPALDHRLPRRERDANLARDELLRDVDERVDRLAQGREPQALVDQLGPAGRE